MPAYKIYRTDLETGEYNYLETRILSTMKEALELVDLLNADSDGLYRHSFKEKKTRFTSKKNTDMAYNESRSNYRSTYAPRGQKKKYSGCKVKKNHTTFKGEKIPLVAFGWMKTRTQFITWVGSTAKSKYQKNENIMKLSLKVTVNGVSRLAWGTYNPSTNMVYIQDLNIIGMPAKNSSFFRKSR